MDTGYLSIHHAVPLGGQDTLDVREAIAVVDPAPGQPEIERAVINLKPEGESVVDRGNIKFGPFRDLRSLAGRRWRIFMHLSYLEHGQVGSERGALIVQPTILDFTLEEEQARSGMSRA